MIPLDVGAKLMPGMKKGRLLSETNNQKSKVLPSETREHQVRTGNGSDDVLYCVGSSR